jgi:twinkle protein
MKNKALNLYQKRLSNMDFSDHGIQINSTGSEVRTICPQCSPTRKKSKEKCLAVNTIDGCWFCHHCGWNGGLNGKDYKVVEYKKTTLPGNVIEYFKSRGISSGTLEQESIGFENSGGKGWIKFPYYHNSVCVNVKYRTSTKDFRQEKGGKKVLYRLDKIRTSTKSTLIITEGEIDALSFVEAGYEATSIPDGAPTPNAKTFNTKFDFLNNTETIFDKYKKIIIAGDNDEPGQGVIQELGRRIGFERCFVVKYPDGCKDGNDVLKNHGKSKLKELVTAARPFPVEGVITPSDCLDNLLYEYNNGVTGGKDTGWRNLDELYTVREGEMTIVTGIPGSGKSNFIDALCVNLMLKHGWRVAYFSPENWPVERHEKTLLEKIIDKSFDVSKFGERMTPDDVKDGISFMDEFVRFIIPKDEIITVDCILKYSRIICLQYGIKALVIDPWNELEHDQKPGEREDQYISRQLTKIRRFARFNGLHIWVIAHPTKLVKNTDGNYDPPTMYDISGGAQWRNKADNGICVYRDFDTNITTIIIQKIRFREIGTLGDCSLKYKFTGRYTQV